MAIWPTTRTRVMTLTSRLLLPRPPSFIISEVFPRAASRAGTKPETKVASRTAPRVNPRTLASIVNDDPIWQLELRCARDLRREDQPPSRPARPRRPRQASAMRKLSVSICLTMRQRVAPSAPRIASSRARNAARPNCMFITFTQAMRRTTMTAPSMAYMIWRSCGPVNAFQQRLHIGGDELPVCLRVVLARSVSRDR